MVYWLGCVPGDERRRGSVLDTGQIVSLQNVQTGAGTHRASY